MVDSAAKTLSITPGGQRRSFLLNDGRQPVGSLHLARTRTTQGEIRASGATWAVIRDPRDRHNVEAGDPAQQPLVALRRDTATVPGSGGALPWNIDGRFVHLHGKLGGGDRAITIECSGWGGLHAAVEVVGAWEQEHLVVLACFFCLLARRRRAITLLST
jgi:hypothetical protein